LRFDGDDVELTQYAVSVTAGQTRPSRFSVRVSLGAVLDGEVEGGGRRHDIGPGIVGGAGVSKQWLRGRWFLTGSAGISASRATTTEDTAGAEAVSIIATDLRVGGLAGRTFGPVSPYVLARAFGGPVMWTRDGDGVTGSDTHHVQLGAGISASTPSGLSVVLDVSAFGERAASLGVSARL
jgi:hypothetical protein